MEKNKVICIVDDLEINQFILKTIIRKINTEIKTLSYYDGEEALAALVQLNANKEELPDIILLDINMPVKDGWQFLDDFFKIKSKFVKEMEIYILSSSDAPDDIKKSKTYKDIAGYLCRPIEAETLKKIVEKDA